eukprot:CAMPEP_0118851770 /NCGR_PEP_ID=MMETSP1163-20130328/1084_1 /TAXON_ID=124430 /ORGANISM="Phaeomonas parva, Strain CCMP2877" /LENGTH=61 /DNA_ID=CAMNT_0006784155 /DNA_START=420 /DNA_END=601 /DNA_ORIENTATION=-
MATRMNLPSSTVASPVRERFVTARRRSQSSRRQVGHCEPRSASSGSGLRPAARHASTTGGG